MPAIFIFGALFVLFTELSALYFGFFHNPLAGIFYSIAAVMFLVASVLKWKDGE